MGWVLWCRGWWSQGAPLRSPGRVSSVNHNPNICYIFTEAEQEGATMPTTPVAVEASGPTTATLTPCLRYDTGVAHLVVDGSRYLVRGAEVHNSAASTLAA